MLELLLSILFSLGLNVSDLRDTSNRDKVNTAVSQHDSFESLGGKGALDGIVIIDETGGVEMNGNHE